MSTLPRGLSIIRAIQDQMVDLDVTQVTVSPYSFIDHPHLSVILGSGEDAAVLARRLCLVVTEHAAPTEGREKWHAVWTGTIDGAPLRVAAILPLGVHPDQVERALPAVRS